MLWVSYGWVGGEEEEEEGEAGDEGGLVHSLV